MKTTKPKKPTRQKQPAKKFALENEAPKPDAPGTPRPILKQRATPSAVRTRENLQRLADGATTEGERTAALDAIKRLEERWDYANPIEVATADIFAGIIPASVDGYASDVMTFEPHESAIASFTQWAIENGFKLRARIRKRDGRETIAVEAEASHVPRLKTLADTIRGAFASLWREFRRVAVADDRDATTFWRGLYDGMMRDPRAPGELLPTRAPQKQPARTGRKKAVVAKGVQLHPYSVGVEMGEKVRLSMPTNEIADAIHALAQQAA